MRAEISLLCIGPDNATEKGSGTILTYSAKEKVLRAGRSLGVCWLLGLVTFIVPVLHIILVPGFFIAGVVGAIVNFKKKEILEQANVVCPVCRAPQELTGSGTRWPISNECSRCGETFYIQDEKLPRLISLSARKV